MLGTGFYGSNDPTSSVKALKEVVVLRIGFNSTRSTSPCYNTAHACNIQSYRKYIHTQNESKYSEMCTKRPCSEMGPVRQNPIQITVRSVHMCNLWSPYVIGRPYIFSSCFFFFLSSFFFLFFPRLISAVGDWMSTILRHMVWP